MQMLYGFFLNNFIRGRVLFSFFEFRKRVINLISKHLEVRQKYSAERPILNSLVCAWKPFSRSLSCLIFYTKYKE